MGNPNLAASERAAVMATIDPDAYTASTVTSDWVDMSDVQRALAIIMAGTLGASATLNAKIEQAQDSSGTGAKDLGKAITALTQAGTDDSDKQALINIRAEELDLANDFTHVRISMTIGTATSDAGAVLIGLDPRYGTADDHDLGSVAEIVA